jgi:hypothetical protein
MTGNVPFLMKDVVLLAASLYLLKQDVARVVTGRRAEMLGRRDDIPNVKSRVHRARLFLRKRLGTAALGGDD